MYFYYRDNKIAMISEGRIDAPNFSEFKKTPTIDEKEKIKQNWHGYIRNGKLEFEKSAQVINQEKKDVLTALTDKVGKIGDKDTKDTINEILKIISV